jgi:hypothetical protein
MKYKANAEKLRYFMLSKNINITKLAKKANVSTISINKALKGYELYGNTCNRIADALELPVTDLFE